MLCVQKKPKFKIWWGIPVVCSLGQTGISFSTACAALWPNIEIWLPVMNLGSFWCYSWRVVFHMPAPHISTHSMVANIKRAHHLMSLVHAPSGYGLCVHPVQQSGDNCQLGRFQATQTPSSPQKNKQKKTPQSKCIVAWSLLMLQPRIYICGWEIWLQGWFLLAKPAQGLAQPGKPEINSWTEQVHWSSRNLGRMYTKTTEMDISALSCDIYKKE